MRHASKCQVVDSMASQQVSRASEMKLTGCFDVLYFRATGYTEMIKCVCVCGKVCKCVDWWLRHQQWVDCFLLDSYQAQLALNSIYNIECIPINL